MRPNQDIIVRRVKVRDHGDRHDGAWKIAYADFVTAMMAFFLLMWLINTTDENTKKGIADYFTTALVTFKDSSGAQGVMSGQNRQSTQESAEDNEPLDDKKYNAAKTSAAKPPSEAKKASLEKTGKASRDEKMLQREKFEGIMRTIRRALNSIKALAAFKSNFILKLTDQGLLIQITDDDKHAMFKLGSATPVLQTRLILRALGKVIAKLPNRISVTGYTDTKPYPNQKGYSNWELSSDRAHATRKILAEYVNDDRFMSVIGKADNDLLNKEDGTAPENRRVSVMLSYRKT